MNTESAIISAGAVTAYFCTGIKQRTLTRIAVKRTVDQNLDQRQIGKGKKNAVSQVTGGRNNHCTELHTDVDICSISLHAVRNLGIIMNHSESLCSGYLVFRQEVAGLEMFPAVCHRYIVPCS